MAFSDAFQGVSTGRAAFQSSAFQTNDSFAVIRDRDRAGDIATPAEIRYLKRIDRIRAWQQARQERQKIARWTKFHEIIDMAMRHKRAANPLDAASGDRPVEKSDQVKKPEGVPTADYPHSLLAETLEKDITPPPQLPPSPESHQRIAKYATDVKALYKLDAFKAAQVATNTQARLKAQLDDQSWADDAPARALAEFAAESKRPVGLKTLDGSARISDDALTALAAFATEHNLTQAQARQRLASFRAYSR